MQINSTIKDRILKYLDYKNISQYQCYSDTGITRGVLTQKFGLSEDNLTKFLNYYTEVDPTWLVTGNGNMLINDNANKQINLSSSDADSHLEDVHGLNKGSYSDAFVEQLLIDHSKLTDSHQKLTDAHYLLAVEVTEANRFKRQQMGYTQDDAAKMVAEKDEEYKKEKE